MTTAAVAQAVRSMPLYGTPCAVCGLPASLMDISGSWTRTWHARATRTTVARFCDVGTPPSQGGQR